MAQANLANQASRQQPRGAFAFKGAEALDNLCRSVEVSPQQFPIRNHPGKFSVFISHTQRDTLAKLLAIELYHELNELLKQQVGLGVWLDVRMKDKSTAAMEEGVRNSSYFILVLSDQYFSRPYCVQELRWAIEMGKPIIPIVDIADKTRIGELLQTAPDDLREIIQRIDFIDLNRSDYDYLQVGITKLLRRMQP